MSATWEDATSYQRGDALRIPRSWRMNAGGLRIVVSRWVNGDADVWYLDAEPWFTRWPLTHRDVTKAKREAIAQVRKSIAAAAKELP